MIGTMTTYRPGAILMPALAVAAIAIGGCGGSDPGFSSDAYDSIQVGDSADSVESALGKPEATDDLGKGAELWTYCDGSTPRYLAVTDGKVSIADFRAPDELRVTGSVC